MVMERMRVMLKRVKCSPTRAIVGYDITCYTYLHIKGKHVMNSVTDDFG
jgi:hypothetical protein